MLYSTSTPTRLEVYVQAGSAIEHVDVLAGISPMAGRFADLPGEYANPAARIQSVLIRGLKSPAPLPRFMSDSYFSVASMGTFRVRNAEVGTTGVYFTAAGGARRIVNVDTVNASNSFRYPPKPGTLFAPPFPFVNSI